MKEKYEELELKVVLFDTQDVITASDEEEYEPSPSVS